jgi:hypothetical protein
MRMACCMACCAGHAHAWRAAEAALCRDARLRASRHNKRLPTYSHLFTLVHTHRCTFAHGEHELQALGGHASAQQQDGGPPQPTVHAMAVRHACMPCTAMHLPFSAMACVTRSGRHANAMQAPRKRRASAAQAPRKRRASATQAANRVSRRPFVQVAEALTPPRWRPCTAMHCHALSSVSQPPVQVAEAHP